MEDDEIHKLAILSEIEELTNRMAELEWSGECAFMDDKLDALYSELDNLSMHY